MEFIKDMYCISKDYSGFNTYLVSELLLSKADALRTESNLTHISVPPVIDFGIKHYE